MVNFQRVLNILFILVLSFVLIGSYLYQYLNHEEPCPLCLLQRLGMIGIASALLLNLRFGIKVQHYGLAILSALVGCLVSLRQMGLHVGTDSPYLGEPVFGFDLYVWAFLVFTCSIFSCALLLIIHGFSKTREYLPTWNRLEKLIFGLIFLITLGNIITTFLECGFTSC